MVLILRAVTPRRKYSKVCFIEYRFHRQTYLTRPFFLTTKHYCTSFKGWSCCYLVQKKLCGINLCKKNGELVSIFNFDRNLLTISIWFNLDFLNTMQSGFSYTNRLRSPNVFLNRFVKYQFCWYCKCQKLSGQYAKIIHIYIFFKSVSHKNIEAIETSYIRRQNDCRVGCKYHPHTG